MDIDEPGRSCLAEFSASITSYVWKEKLKKYLTDRGLSGIIFLVLVRTNKYLESWLSGRRRTIGNRVGVMSVSRVQIPDSPPKSTGIDLVSVLFIFFIAEKVEYNFCKKYGIFFKVAQKWPNLLKKFPRRSADGSLRRGFFSSRQLHRPSGE